nr:integral membrane protein GPR155 [Hymenolepis microstoma]
MKSAAENLELDNVMFQAMVPVLIQCFGLILLGFVAGNLKLLTHSQAKGLGIYVTSFALPAIFFTVMVSIEFSNVDWYLVLSVSIGKAIAFFCTMATVLVFSLGKSVGAAGLMAIFVSQSNDVALAYPILRLLYPDLAHYIYLFAPTQLVLLNPFGYFALEWHRNKEKLALSSVLAQGTLQPPQRSSFTTLRKILKVLRFVASNPLFFMTVLGVIFNLILKHKLPEMVQGFFNDLGASFNATALFYLGFNMVGKLKGIKRREVYTLVFILISKVILSPFITREVTKLLTAHQPRNVSLAKSNFAFLYAAAPTAPPVFLFASKFGIIPEVISGGLVIGTFLYAPIMFILGGMATLVDVDPKFYDSTLERAAVYLSWGSVLCCTWVLTVLLLTKKACRMPYRFLLCLITSVMVFCTNFAVRSIWGPSNPSTGIVSIYGDHIYFAIFFIACTASRVWTAFLSIAVLYQVRYKRPPSKCRQIFFYTLGMSLPTAVTLILILSAGGTSTHDVNPAFYYGKAQQLCSTIVLCVCLSVSLLSLVWTFRLNTSISTRGMTPHAINDELRILISPEEEAASTDTTSPCSDDEIRSHNRISSSPNRIEQTITPAIHPHISQIFHSIDGESFHRFFILNILLLISMFFGVCICIWRLTRETQTGVFIAVEFLDQAFNFGQGILIFSVFGFDVDLIINPLISCISTMRFWVSTNLSWPSLRMARRLKEEEVEQFVATQLPACMQQICTTLRLSGHTLESVFYFKDFHHWVSQKSAAEGRHQSREDTASLLLALTTRNLVRRLTGNIAGIRGVEHGEIENSALSTSSSASSQSPSRLSPPEESPILYQHLVCS